jgi:hypothetical protein
MAKEMLAEECGTGKGFVVSFFIRMYEIPCQGLGSVNTTLSS